MAHTVENYISTGLDDLRISMPYEKDLTLLRRLYVRCQELALTSRAKIVNRRIKELKKEAASVQAS